MQCNIEKRSALKAQFNSDVEDGRKSRAFLAQSRDLLKQAAAIYVSNVVESGRLRNEASNLRAEALALRGGNRELCLALAFLNGTAYSRCETNPSTSPDCWTLAHYIKDCLPTELQEKDLSESKRWVADQAKDIAKRWVESGTLRLRDFYQEFVDRGLVQARSQQGAVA
jgi:hypothetical protein